MIKKILFALIILALMGGGLAYYLYNKPVASIGKKKPDVEISANELLLAYENDENEANASYGEKIIQVTGLLSEIENTETGDKLFIETDNPMSGIICELEPGQEISMLKIGDEITVKGRCTGFLSDVVLVQSTLIKQ